MYDPNVVSFQLHYSETPNGDAGFVSIDMRHVRGVARASNHYLDVKLVTGTWEAYTPCHHEPPS